MDSEHERLQTFKGCGVFPIKLKSKLALCGLYYNKIHDSVECFSCNSKFSVNENTDIIKLHCRVSPNCRFLLRETSNKPIDDSLLILPERCADECGLGSMWTSRLYSEHSERIASYDTWLGNNTPGKLSSAGFWFTQKSDIVACWKCCVQINNWSTEDDPWIEHIKYSKDCELVRGFLKTYEGRLHSFQHWPGKQPKENLAFAGFFYFGSGDITETICCQQTFKKWDHRHTPTEIHKKLEPSCRMMSFFPKIPTDLVSTFRELNLTEKTKASFIKQNVYYERFSGVFVCTECHYSASDYRCFVHALDCKQKPI
jgi:hypothetical protein